MHRLQSQYLRASVLMRSVTHSHRHSGHRASRFGTLRAQCAIIFSPLRGCHNKVDIAFALQAATRRAQLSSSQLGSQPDSKRAREGFGCVLYLSIQIAPRQNSLSV
eukprot:3565633-Pyramimonas_sp.AAC.1